MKSMLTVEQIKNAISGTEYWYYGIRIDSGIRYNVGDTANNSRQLFQDPEYDEDGELLYPRIEDGINEGLYDAGELDGTCAISFEADDDASIQAALDQVMAYAGDYIHILGGNSAEDGNDRNEVIIRNAKVLLPHDND